MIASLVWGASSDWYCHSVLYLLSIVALLYCNARWQTCLSVAAVRDRNSIRFGFYLYSSRHLTLDFVTKQRYRNPDVALDP